MADEPTPHRHSALRAIRAAPGVLVRGRLRGELARHRAAHLHAARLVAWPSATARSSPRRCASTPARYAAGGLPALARAVDIEQRSGRHERLFVRVVRGGAETLFVSMPPEWDDFDVSSARRAQRLVGAGAVGLAHCAPRGRHRRSSLDGTLLQVGKSTESREELLARFRTDRHARLGGHRPHRARRRDSGHAAHGRADSPADWRGQRDHPHRQHRNARAGRHRPRRHRRAERLVQRDARSDQHAHRGHGQRARQRRPRPADADDPAARRGRTGPGRATTSRSSARRSRPASRSPNAFWRCSTR